MKLFLGDYPAKIIQQTSSLVLKYICQVKLMLAVSVRVSQLQSMNHLSLVEVNQAILAWSF
jgi:hypothetical protein